MRRQYTSKDIIEMAVKAKDKGIDLYMALARNSGNYHVAHLFAALAKDEQKHKLKLMKWLEKIQSEKPSEAYPGEGTLFLQSLVDDNTFNLESATKKALEKTISEEEVLRASVGFEKDFILFLHELKRQTLSGEAGIIDKLIDEEMGHIREIIDIRDKVAKSK
ncbi:MAG: hypothetical protein HQL30_11230 [Candidatus Omnitrophica bacterium]|nr:hypothetical protein [Candidatus Omnitrophota bacterium]